MSNYPNSPTTTTSSNKYQLSQEVMTDGNPIRCMAYNSKTSTLYTGSESGIVSSIQFNDCGNNDVSIFSNAVVAATSSEGGSGIDNYDELRHDHHITALLSIDNFNSHVDTFSESIASVFITGCKDCHIRVFDSISKKRLFLLKGHDKPVTSLSLLQFSNADNADNDDAVYLVSGSWDGTAKVWNLKNGSCCATLDGHENTVSVQGLPPPPTAMSSSSSTTRIARLATGSAGIAQGNTISDYKIRIYELSLSTSPSSLSTNIQVSLQSTIANDHYGPIRSLYFDDNFHLLLSSSNDGSVKLRNIDSGSCVQTLDFPLNLQKSSDMNDEDDLGLNIYLQSHHQQQQQQPPMLLDVCTNHQDSIIACGEDGTVIIWSNNTPAATTTTTTTNSDHNIQIIPHPNCVWKVLPLPNGDIITACHDSNIRIFTKDINRIATKETIESFYNHVLESKQQKSSGPSQDEIEKLPKWEMNFSINGKGEGSVQVFNKNGKAIAAQWSQASKTWIEVGEVTGQMGGGSSSGSGSGGTIDGKKYDFIFPIEIDMRGGGVQTLHIGYNNGENPFVTAQQFIDEHMLDQGYLAQIADYIRTRVGQDGYVPTIGVESGGVISDNDPSPMDYSPTPTPAYQHLPMRGYKSFETGADKKTLAKVSTKIAEFNTAFNSNLSSNEISVLLENLISTIAATSRYHTTTISDNELQIVLKMIKNWSLVHIFPALDLARLVVLHPDASVLNRSAYWIELICTAMDKCDELIQNINSVEGPAKIAIPMLTMRLIANYFRGGDGSRLAIESHLSR